MSQINPSEHSDASHGAISEATQHSHETTKEENQHSHETTKEENQHSHETPKEENQHSHETTKENGVCRTNEKQMNGHEQMNGHGTKKPNGTISPKRWKPEKGVPFSPRIELIFTICLFAETIIVLTYFISKNDFQAIVEILVCVAITASGVYLTKGIFKSFAMKFGNPTHVKPMNIRKFQDQGWQLVIHLIFTAMEILILKDETWWQDPNTCWVASGPKYIVRPLLKRLYVLQLGARFWSSFSHRFLELHHKDYFIMFIHHLVTIALLGGTYMINFYGVGVLILLVHNASDIIVDLLKMSNHMGFEKKNYFYLTEILFVTNLTTWAVSRLWIFPFHLVYTAVVENQDECIEHGALPHCNVMRVMLVALVVMHVWWFYLFLKMGYRLVTTGNAHAAARAEYEGESDDERHSKAE